MATANPIGTLSTTLELDHMASKYGLFRHETETLANFKERFLSVFSFPTNNSEVGFAAAIARSLHTYPRIVGYMEVDPGVVISYDGFKLIIDGEEIPYALRNKYLEDLVNDYGSQFTLYLDDEKYLYKNIEFIFPFSNFLLRKEKIVRPGTNYLKDDFIVAETFRSSSPYFQNQKLTADLLTAKGDYYFDGKHTLVVYPSDNLDSISISYAQNWNYIPIVYCPVSVFSMTNLINDPLIPFIENGNSFIDSTEELYKDLLWESFTQNNIFWKANQNSPRSEFGTYYGN